MHDVFALLEGRDRRSIGNVNAVIAAVEHDRSLFDVLFHGLFSDDQLIRMRAADAIEKISRKHPDWLQPYKEPLLTQVAQSKQQEVHWHVAQLFPRLTVDQQERATMFAVLLDYLTDGEGEEAGEETFIEIVSSKHSLRETLREVSHE